jgi:hypothetical protein
MNVGAEKGVYPNSRFAKVIEIAGLRQMRQMTSLHPVLYFPVFQELHHSFIHNALNICLPNDLAMLSIILSNHNQRTILKHSNYIAFRHLIGWRCFST